MEKPVSELIVQPNKSTKMIMHSGKKPETDDRYDEIVEWILMNRKLGITVTSWEVIVKASTIKEELKKKAWVHSKSGALGF